MSTRRNTRFGLAGITVAVLVIIGVSGYSLRLSSLSPAETTHLSAQDGAEIYMTRCMSCHQMNGRGVPGVFPPLAGSEWVTDDKGVAIRIVLNGLTGEIKVGGDGYSGAMPPWQSFLDDTQVAELLTYIRTSWGNDTTAVSPDEVERVRAAVADRREPWTAEELMQEENRGVPGDSTANAGG